MYGLCEIDFIAVCVFVILLYHDGVRNLGTEIIYEETSENLLKNRLLFSSMKTCQANGIFQTAEGRFDPPSQMI